MTVQSVLSVFRDSLNKRAAKQSRDHANNYYYHNHGHYFI